jgi:hypothetical protein
VKGKSNCNSSRVAKLWLRQSKSNSGRDTPGILKVLLPPRQSRGISLLN